MKRKLFMLTTVLTASLGLVACESKGESQDLVKIGMMTDSGTIDDRSFNQATWEGIERYKSEHQTITTQYIQTLGQTTAEYMQAADSILQVKS